MNMRQRGMTLMEVLFSVAGVAILIFATISANSTALLSTRSNQDKQFATQKALSMLEELKSMVQVNNGGTITVLDRFDDGSLYFPRLTTIGDKTGATATQPPDEPISGNTSLGNSWLYVRQISVRTLTDPTDPTLIISSSDVRLVRVRVYRNDPTGPRLMAEVASVVRTLAVNFPTTQVYDVYAIAIENVPGWWVNMSSLISFVQNAINDLQNRQPGLQFRTHWIKHLGFGRDTQYIPYVNANTTMITANTPDPVSYVYFYPGALPPTYTPEAGGAAVTTPAQYYYPPSNFEGTIRTEAGLRNPLSATTNPFPYALADQYNHVMRYQDELALYTQRKNARNGSGALIYPNEEMTLRLLLDDMVLHPSNYTNAIVINLHGELMPFPPMRNYSDAAKKPDYYHGRVGAPNGVRVVTHPQQLTYDGTSGLGAANAEAVDLRVYSYLTNPSLNAAGNLVNGIYRYPGGVETPLIDGLLAREFLPEPITVTLKGVNWVPAAGDVKAISGGVNLNPATGVRDPYATVNALTTDLVAPAHRMYYTSAFIAPVAPALVGDTVIKLYNSPLVSPCVANDCSTGGLGSYRQLYGQEYIPGALEDFSAGTNVTAFQAGNNLDAAADTTKNTARWILHVPAASFTAAQNNSMLRVETRIGDWDQTAVPPAFVGAISGGYATAANLKPADFEATYFWRGTPTWLYGAAGVDPALPPSERYQIQGDPRHMPYADLKKTHTNPGGMTANTNLGRGYNPYFDDFEAASEVGNPINGFNYPAEGNREGAEMVGTLPGPYNVVNGNKNLQLRVNGATLTTVVLTTGARSALQIVNELNASGTLAGKATADVVCMSAPCTNTTGRLRFTSDVAGNATNIQIVNIANNPAATFGMDNAVHTLSAWDGYNYAILGVNYGIKNDGPVVGDPAATQRNVDNDGWTTSNGAIEFDIPRAYQIIRTSLMKTNALFTTMTGWPYFYIGIGGEIGYDSASGFNDNVPVSRRPFTGTDTAQYFENTITPGKGYGDGLINTAPFYGQVAGAGNNVGVDRSGVKYIQAADNTWWGMPWLGELYPDQMYDFPTAGVTDWKDFGNLATGVNSAANPTFRRVRREDVKGNDPADRTHTIGTVFTHSSRRTMMQGMPTFFWTGSATGVEADSSGATGNLATAGTEINNNYNFPLDDPILATRPFQLAAALPATDGLGLAIYGANNTVTDLADFYNSNFGSEKASALIAVRQAATNDATFVVENGLSPTGDAGTDFIARWSFLSLVQGYFEAGLFNTRAAPATAQMPRVIITSPNPNTDPNDPSSITITWNTQYARWDGKPYTTAYPANFNPAYAMSYWVTYSANNGSTWQYLDGTAATPGVRPPAATYLSDSHRITGNTVSWSTPAASFPAGAYIIRVDGYRDNYQLHYAYHQYQTFINRTTGP